jgi:hypothetical protein
LRGGEDDIALEIDKLFGEIGNSVKRASKIRVSITAF